MSAQYVFCGVTCSASASSVPEIACVRWGKPDGGTSGLSSLRPRPRAHAASRCRSRCAGTTRAGMSCRRAGGACPGCMGVLCVTTDRFRPAHAAPPVTQRLGNAGGARFFVTAIYSTADHGKEAALCQR